jgi:hypothetical protein
VKKSSPIQKVMELSGKENSSIQFQAWRRTGESGCNLLIFELTPVESVKVRELYPFWELLPTNWLLSSYFQLM